MGDRRLTRRAFVGGVALTLGSEGALLRAADALARVDTLPGDVQHFVTRPDLRPPTLTIVHHGATAAGDLFLAPSSGPGQRGVMIVDDRGSLVYFHPTTPNTAMNFRAARYRGKPVLTWWEGKATSGLGTGTHVILDDRYRVVARIPAGGGRESDLHEFLITPHDTALVTSYETRTADLTAVGGPVDGVVIGSVVQELALPSGRLLFEWRSLDHVAITETHAVYTGHPLDYFHVNSIDLTEDGNLLVSARNTWAIYKLDRHSGRVLWRLGGRKSDFHMGRGTVFAWQHDARQHPGGRISLFDDGADPQVEPQSRALILQLDGVRKTARLVRAYPHRPGRLVSHFMGSAQLLENGNMLVGWGSEPYVTEFAPDGRVAFDAKLPRGGQNYRALRFPWTGHPTQHPAAVYRFHKGMRRVHVSWNGATEVAAWRLESGRSAAHLAASPAVPRRGFETVLDVPAGMRVGRAVALDHAGHALGRSELLHV